jgi:hypothetical protein
MLRNCKGRFTSHFFYRKSRCQAAVDLTVVRTNVSWPRCRILGTVFGHEASEGSFPVRWSLGTGLGDQVMGPMGP